MTIEDTAELSLNHPHVVRLESRPGSFDGAGVVAVAIRDLLRNTLRMRPDRIIVGEVRGGEVLEMLQAMNTGHDGSMGTIHASSPREYLYRLEMLAGFAGFQGTEASMCRQIANAIDFMVQIGRLSNGRRRIILVTEVTGISDDIISTQELYRYNARTATTAANSITARHSACTRIHRNSRSSGRQPRRMRPPMLPPTSPSRTISAQSRSASISAAEVSVSSRLRD